MQTNYLNNPNNTDLQEKRAAYETQASENNYHSLFEQATDAIMVTDLNGNFKDVNSALCAMFGYTKEELLNLNVRALLDPEHIREHPLRYDLLAAGKNVFNERKMVHKNGRIIYVEANAKKYIDNRVIVIARDITERRRTEGILQKSEADLQTIFATTDTIYVLMDHGLRIISYNARAASFAQKELGHSIEISEHFLDYFPEEKRPALLAHMQAGLTGKNIHYDVSYPQPDGSCSWYHVKIFPISRGCDHVYGLMMAVSDITEKIVLEQKLEEERIKKQLELTDAVITAEENERHAISLELHDNVNQLLATSRIYLGIAKNADLAKKNQLIDKTDKLIDLASNETRNLSHSLISPFLEQYGLVEAVDYLVETILNGSTVIIHKDMKEVDGNGIPEKLKLSIYRIMQEQLINILKYARASNIYINLGRENDRLILSIKDDGTGFDTSAKSSGIGLLNIRTRASLFKGSMNIISSSGNGCELIVSFHYPMPV
jgi:PAS domain S-box-containing protein